MFNNEKYPIREDWEEYYKTLENIRRSGICNMFGASPYLKALCPELSSSEASNILCNWMHNYSVLSEKHGWQR